MRLSQDFEIFPTALINCFDAALEPAHSSSSGIYIFASASLQNSHDKVHNMLVLNDFVARLSGCSWRRTRVDSATRILYLCNKKPFYASQSAVLLFSPEMTRTPPSSPANPSPSEPHRYSLPTPLTQTDTTSLFFCILRSSAASSTSADRALRFDFIEARLLVSDVTCIVN